MTKNIVVCLDGTWNQAETQNTNVHKIMEVAAREGQLKGYFSGVGIAGHSIGNLFDGITGKGVFRNARAAFTFVAHNYCPGDRIFIFGFSRGAYTARHLAGMLTRCSLKWSVEQSFHRYLAALDQPYALLGAPVHFLGLFDCVAANHFYTAFNPRLRALNSPSLEPDIIHFRHAVAEHERRWSFRPTIYADSDQKTFKQALFPGCHGDVGGLGRDELSCYSFCWMVWEAYGQGLDLELVKCRNSGVPPHFTHGKVGHALGWIQTMNPSATPGGSDFLTTKLGLQYDRAPLKLHPSIGPTPTLNDLEVCPRRCGDPMF